jgi:hypothetical protein
VVPDLTHVLPIVDDTVLHWVLEGQDTPLLLSLITDINFLVIHANHCRLVLGTTDHCREVLGASSPANPALHIPDPLSMMTAAFWDINLFIMWRKIHRFIGPF